MARPRKAIAGSEHGTRAVVYLRVSEEDNARKKGLEVQETVARGYVERRGYTVVQLVRDDGVSGATRWQERRGLRRAFRLCETGQADVIVAYHQDRFARKMGVFEDIRDRALAKRIRLETADGRVLTQKDDFLVGDVQSLVAAIERRRISERFLAARRFRGSVDGRGSGPLPYGYALAGEDGDELMVDEDAAVVIRKLLGMRRLGVAYRRVAEALNAEGHRTATGRDWTVASVQGIERNAELYASGVRTWDDVTSALRWPVILRDERTEGEGV